MSHVITRKQKQALARLSERHGKFPHYASFSARALGQSYTSALRKLEGSGLVNINKAVSNCFRYSITPSGKDFLEGKGLPA